MRISSAFLAFMLLIFVSGCSAVSDRDLADLRSSNVIVKKAAIQRIAKGRPFPLSLLDRFLDKENERKAVGIIAELLVGGKESEDIESTLVKSLGQLSKRTEIPVDILINKLRDENPRIRLVVVDALGKTRNRKATPVLVKLLEKEKAPHAIIWAIGEIGDPSATPYLDRLLASEDQYVRFNAYKALLKIGNGRTEDDSTAQTGNKPSERKTLGIAQRVLKTYQYMMISLFQRIAGLKRA